MRPWFRICEERKSPAPTAMVASATQRPGHPPNFNSIAYCFGSSCDMRSPLENCHHFLCLSFGVHSIRLSQVSLTTTGLLLVDSAFVENLVESGIRP
jgi:hypothetical protein